MRTPLQSLLQSPNAQSGGHPVDGDRRPPGEDRLCRGAWGARAARTSVSSENAGTGVSEGKSPFARVPVREAVPSDPPRPPSCAPPRSGTPLSMHPPRLPETLREIRGPTSCSHSRAAKSIESRPFLDTGGSGSDSGVLRPTGVRLVATRHPMELSTDKSQRARRRKLCPAHTAVR